MTKALQDSLNEVTESLQDCARSYKVASENYYNSRLPHLARIPVPVQRKLLKTGYSFSSLPHDEQRKIWHYIWNKGAYFEVCSQAIFYFESVKPSLTLDDWKLLRQWPKRLDNWAHSDGMSNLFAHLHEEHPQLLYPVFQNWNVSKDSWERRQSIVSLFYYSSMRKHYKTPYTKGIRLVKNLLDDEAYYVQKGVGWTLRELFNVYPEKTSSFLKTHVAAIHPDAWQAATEKLSPSVKKELKQLRKERRRPQK